MSKKHFCPGPQGFTRTGESEKLVVKLRADSGAMHLPAGGAELSEFLPDPCAGFPQVRVQRTFGEADEVLRAQLAKAADRAGQELPDLAAYYHLTVEHADQARALATELARSPLVEAVYHEPPAIPSLYMERSPTLCAVGRGQTPDYAHRQAYLNQAPEGVDARYAWVQAGGRGAGVRVIDVEGAWNFCHEDVLGNPGGLVGGCPIDSLNWENHGTAIEGVIRADNNRFGITGLAPEASFCGVSIFGPGGSPARAIKTAADRLQPGDIILVGLQREGPGCSGTGQDGYIPIEWWPADFAAIRYATACGLLVVAAAGNGGRDLDSPCYRGRFDRALCDSGAIMVGAGASPGGSHGPDRARLPFSNFGACLDAQGWGCDVTTTGYGDLHASPDPNERYTAHFGGTSGSMPIVAGALACLQGILRAQGLDPLECLEARELLRRTGTPQADAPERPRCQRIGPRPDLRAALEYQFQADISVGLAEKFWDEAVAFPSDGNSALWIYVEGWKRFDRPGEHDRELIQQAVLGMDTRIRAWYRGPRILGIAAQRVEPERRQRERRQAVA